jgi:inner membrane protein
MHIATHGLLSWLLAASALPSRRDRTLATLAGVAADADGLGLVVDFVTGAAGTEASLWLRWHHVAGHNFPVALLVTAGVAAFARQKARSAVVALAAFHLHLLCDLVGSAGPNGERWPMPYLWPFSARPVWDWSGQWPLNGWPNVVITFGAVLLALWIGWRRGFSPVELVSVKLDGLVVATLRQRFGQPSVAQPAIVCRDDNAPRTDSGMEKEGVLPR